MGVTVCSVNLLQKGGFMKIKVSSLSVHQNAKIVSLLYVILSFLYYLVMFLFDAIILKQNNFEYSPKMLYMPIVSFISVYVSGIIGCLLYNLISKYNGGFKFEYKE